MTKMMISELPSDLVEEILTRVPLKYMRAVRLTCKKWNDISKSQILTKKHIEKASVSKKGEYEMIVMIGYTLYLKSIVINGDIYTEHKGKLTYRNEQVRIHEFFHCEGLLLCILNEGSKLVVWNPYLGQPRWIEPARYTHNLTRLDRFCYVLGYENDKNKSCRRHKFSRFEDYCRFPPGMDEYYWYEIYDLDSDLWTTLDVTPYWRITYDLRGVSLKGNTYWFAAKRNEDYNFDDHIICFDFAKESFGLLLPLLFGSAEFMTLSCVREEKLAVLLQRKETNPYELELWVTTKIETQELSWSKFLTVETVLDIKGSFISQGFFIDEEKKVVIGFNKWDFPRVNIIGENNGYFRSLDIIGEDRVFGVWISYLCSYVPSSVQIKQPSGEERKQESESEKL